MKQGIISPIKLTGLRPKTLEHSLSKEGYSRIPNTSVFVTPDKDVYGKYKTGLDEDAQEILDLPEEERKIEQDRIRELRKNLEHALGEDLSPRSDFYRRIGQEGGVRLKDSDNAFNLNHPREHVTFLWVSKIREVAPSLLHFEMGKVDPSTRWYVKNEDVEAKVEYQRKSKYNKAAGDLDKMTPSDMVTIGRILNLPVSNDMTREKIYNELDAYISSNQQSLDKFAEVCALPEEMKKIKALIEDLLHHNILRERGLGGAILEGDENIAISKLELLDKLLNPKHQDLYIYYQTKLKQKQQLR